MVAVAAEAETYFLLIQALLLLGSDTVRPWDFDDWPVTIHSPRQPFLSPNCHTPRFAYDASMRKKICEAHDPSAALVYRLNFCSSDL